MAHWMTRHGWLGILVVALIALVAFAACGDDDSGTTKTPGASTVAATPTPGPVQALAAIFYPESGRVLLKEALEQKLIDKFLFTDGTKSQTMFDDLGVANFEGAQGTSPGGPNAAFDAAYKAKTGKSPAEVNYTREGYDAVYMIALAAVAANSSKGSDIRDNLRFVANPPGDTVGIGTAEFTKAVGLLQQGKDINYEGASGPVDMDVNGDLAAGLVEVWKIIGGKITDVPGSPVRVDLAGNTGTQVPAGSLKAGTATPTSALKIGALLSFTGDLKDFGQPILDAMQLAADEINAAGGVWGKNIEIVKGDDGTTPEQGKTDAQRLVNVEKVNAIVGALGSGVTLPVAENVTGPAGILQISPASTAATLTAAKDSDFLFRTPISDDAQAIVLADLANQQGYTTVCTMYVNTPYGQGLTASFTKDFQKLGGTVKQQVSIEQQQTTYVTEIKKCVGK